VLFPLLALLAGGSGPAALAAGIEGVYRYGGKDSVTVKIVRRKGADEFAAVAVSASSDRHRNQVGQTVLELRRVGPNEYRGRCSAYHVRASDDVAAWLEVLRAELLDTGDLRCALKTGSGASVQVVYKRVEVPERKAGPKPDPKQESRELAGDWKHPDGLVVHYLGYRDSYIGKIVKLSSAARNSGFRVGEETTRVKRTAPGVYKGRIKAKSRTDRKGWWEDVEITVRGHELTSIRLEKDGQDKVRSSAVRVPKYSTELEPDKEPDPGDLSGQWRATDGTITRYSRKGNTYTGYVVKPSPEDARYGFRVGEECIRLTRITPSTYIGKVKAKTSGGKDEWWDHIEVSVRKNTLKSARYMRNGRQEKGSAVRVGGPPDAATESTP